MLTISIATKKDEMEVEAIRYEMLKVVNGLSEEYIFDDEFQKKTKEYFQTGDQTTVLAIDCGQVVGCATICYINLMPTFHHPSGKRAHIMNVYTRANYRRKGIASQMMRALIDEGRKRGVTEISLDATEEGRGLYEKCGFVASREGMVLHLIDR